MPFRARCAKSVPLKGCSGEPEQRGSTKHPAAGFRQHRIELLRGFGKARPLHRRPGFIGECCFPERNRLRGNGPCPER